MALNVKNLVMRQSSFVSKSNNFVSSNLRSSNKFVFSNLRSPLPQKFNQKWFCTVSEELVQTMGSLILTEACVQRLKKIRAEDDSYLRILVRINDFFPLTFPMGFNKPYFSK